MSASHRPNSLEVHKTSKSATSLVPLRILILDDHALVRRGVKETLTEGIGKMEFGEATNAREGQSLFLNESWNLVLLDINIPGRSGLDLLPEFKKAKPNVPILIVTIHTEEEFAMRAFKAGADGYVSKNAISDEVIVAVRKVLEGGRYVSPALAERMVLELGKDPRRPVHATLSSREFQVMRLIALGRAIKEIAAELSLSDKTISTYRKRISEKTHLGTNVEIARYAIQNRLVD